MLKSLCNFSGHQRPPPVTANWSGYCNLNHVKVMLFFFFFFFFFSKSCKSHAVQRSNCLHKSFESHSNFISHIKVIHTSKYISESFKLPKSCQSHSDFQIHFRVKCSHDSIRNIERVIMDHVLGTIL